MPRPTPAIIAPVHDLLTEFAATGLGPFRPSELPWAGIALSNGTLENA